MEDIFGKAAQKERDLYNQLEQRAETKTEKKLDETSEQKRQLYIENEKEVEKRVEESADKAV